MYLVAYVNFDTLKFEQTPRLLGQNCKFFKSPLSRNSQKRLEHKENQTNYRSITRKPRVMLEFQYIERELLLLKIS